MASADPRSLEEQKYDRQIRMWGPHGQRALAESSVCVLHSGPTASETLKNLVLPGLGDFTLVDDAKVEVSDLGNNFFVTEDSLGEPRAKVVTEWLLEMNNEVKGKAVIKNPETLIDDDLKFFDGFNLVIVCQLAEKPMRKLASYLYSKHIPLLVLKSYGLLGYARVAVPEHPVFESHPDGERFDLFLHPSQLESFPELAKFLARFKDVDSLDDKKHGEVPFLALLHNHIEIWKKKHDGKVPEGFDESEAFKEQISKASRLDKAKNVEENHEEAMEYAKKVYQPVELASEVQEVFDSESAEKLTSDSKPFWILVRAVKDFYKTEGKGCWPCAPALPDVTTDTETYVELSNIFLARHERDVKLISGHVQRIIKEIGSKATIPDKQITYFVKNFRTCGFVRMRSIEQEYDSKTFRTDDVNEAFEDVDERREPTEDNENPSLPYPHSLHWYFALRAAEAFHTKNGRYAGTTKGKDALAADIKELNTLQTQLFKDYKLTVGPDKHTAAEIARVAGGELHVVAALIGGVGSQEAIKVLIGQYLPLNNTFIYNGVNGTGTSLEF